MTFFDRLKATITASSIDRRSYWVHTRCKRCGEVVSARIDLLNDLSEDFETKQRRVHKVLVGDGRNRCFQRIEITLIFDKNKKLIDRSITGGEFLHPNEVDAARAAYEQAIARAKAQAQAEHEARSVAESGQMPADDAGGFA
ncbi:MAG: hypothetical protein DSY55_02875 [Clostridia bacterium]|nr:MAG: hypothetical protein DSY55_02875 [Clostridia bacterium]